MSSLCCAPSDECSASRDRLMNGLSKLQETNILVEQMKGELAALAPVLEAKAAATAELLQRVAADQQAAAAAGVTVAAEEKEIAVMQQQTQVGHRAEDCAENMVATFIVLLTVQLIAFCTKQLSFALLRHLACFLPSPR